MQIFKKPQAIIIVNPYGTLGLRWDWKATEKLSFGLAAQTPTFYERFDTYRDVLKSTFNSPANGTVGLAYKIFSYTTILLDYQYIHCKGTRLLRDRPQDGGLGWKNMHVFKVGLGQVINKALSLRLGYNCGKSPIANDRVFANVLAPAVVEHHISAGLTMKPTKNHTFSFMGYYVPMKKQTESGTGDAFRIIGKGAQIGMRQFGLQVGYQGTF